MLYKYHLHWSLHPEKTEEWYEDQKNRMTPDEIARELDIEYNLSVSGRVFSAFNERKHLIELPYKINAHKPVYRIWDFGKTNATLFCQKDEFGRKQIFHERVLTDSDTLQQVKVVIEDSLQLADGLEFIDICDPAGNYDDGRGLSTHVEILKQHHVFPEFSKIVKIPTKDRKSRAITWIQLDLQSCPAGEDAFQLYVSPDRRKGPVILLQAMQSGYAYKTDLNGNITDLIDEKHPYEDVMDCLIYWYLQIEQGPENNKKNYRPYLPSLK